MTNYPKCRTCRYYEPLPKAKEWGKCSRIYNVSDPVFLSGADEGCDSLIMQPDDFGCILHEPIEQGVAK